ncbi:hypothetical protein HYPSUDRAFT_196142 [Hypholoma sublateritium FD-334 SS-4]|uniref:Uncharacterized protein n=1 Tax=Hypholoma sublateritium (strain FD-334 SS-4) TaxID=945553 RepID=A0A0D2N099_HYPSF|nr:hypothetical protein HYPSUDRAFT_196142 [Hypholoma sublateritium FD-334 SS-4]
MSGAPADARAPAPAPAYGIVRVRAHKCIDRLQHAQSIEAFHTYKGSPLDTEVDAYDAFLTTAHFLLCHRHRRVSGNDLRDAPRRRKLLQAHAAHGARAALVDARTAAATAGAGAGASTAEIIVHSHIPAMGLAGPAPILHKVCIPFPIPPQQGTARVRSRPADLGADT